MIRLMYRRKSHSAAQKDLYTVKVKYPLVQAYVKLEKSLLFLLYTKNYRWKLMNIMNIKNNYS